MRPTITLLCCGLASTLALAGLVLNVVGSDPRKSLEESTGVDLCSGRKDIPTLNDFQLSDLFVGNENVPCARWPKAFPGVSIVSGSFRTDQSRIPIVIYNKSSSEALGRGSASSVIVRVMGGPAGSISPSEFDQPYLRSMAVGDAMINIGYSGTRYISHYPSPELVSAREEIISLVSRIKNNRPRSRVFLVGESLGGPIVASVLHERPDLPVEAIVLVNPLLLSPTEALQNFARMDKAGEIKDVGKEVRVFNRSSADWKNGQWQNISSRELFKHFFSQNDSNTRFVDNALLRTAGGARTFVIYGTNDHVIGLEQLNSLTQLKSIRLFAVRGMNHEIRVADFDNLTVAFSAAFH